MRQCANRAPIVRQCFFALAHGACANAPMLAGGMGESARAHLPPRGCRANQPRANAATGYRLLQAARCTASRCDRSVTAPACKPWAAPLVRPHRCPRDERQGTYKRFSGAGRGEVAATIPMRLWAVLRRLRALGLLALASRRSAAMGNRLRHAKSARKSLICMGPSRGRPIAGNSHRVVSLVDTNF